jgi:hypothetical protein
MPVMDIVSIPIRCHEKTIDVGKKMVKRYWGEFHGHTEFSSDGDGDPATFYPWARDVACLDFCMMSDHHHSLNEGDMRKIQMLAAAHLNPGVFVTFVGYEWGSGGVVGCNRNHQNIVYLGNDGDVAPDMATLEDLWVYLARARKECITIPHHPGYPLQPGIGTDWSHYNQYYQPVLEIFSDHGGSEYYGNPYTLRWEEQGHFVLDALMAGYKYGITASSDNHRTHPGTNGRTVTPYAVTGLTAVCTQSLTRQSIIDALRNRSCYATSGARKIIVEFTINDQPMGSDIYLASGTVPRQIDVTVAGTCKLRLVEIIKNGEVYHRTTPETWLENINIVDNIPVVDTDFYYIRVTQEDTFQAWSSPIWVSEAKGFYLPIFPIIVFIAALTISFMVVSRFWLGARYNSKNLS